VIGKIVTWNAEKFYGFVGSPGLSENIFFHGSALLIAPGSTVAVGDQVEFQKDHDRNGRPRAVNIRIIDDRQSPPTDLPLPPAREDRRRERREEAEKLWRNR
jgi:cold shock CspA family protein